MVARGAGRRPRPPPTGCPRRPTGVGELLTSLLRGSAATDISVPPFGIGTVLNMDGLRRHVTSNLRFTNRFQPGHCQLCLVNR